MDYDINLVILGKRIKDLRIERNMTPRDISEVIGEDELTIIKIEAGQFDIKIEDLFLIAARFRVTMSELFDGF